MLGQNRHESPKCFQRAHIGANGVTPARKREEISVSCTLENATKRNIKLNIYQHPEARMTNLASKPMVWMSALG